MSEGRARWIGVDLLILSQFADTGMVTYTAAILPYLFRNMPDCEFILFAKAGVDLPFEIRDFANVTVIHSIWMRSSWLWKLVGISLEAFVRRLDLLFLPVARVPLVKTCKVAAFVHDVGFLSLPKYLSEGTLRPTQVSTRLVARLADLILTNSRFTRDEFCNFYRVPPSRVVVTYLGYETGLFDDAPVKAEERARVCERYELMGPFALYLGVIQGRKNLVALIKACAMWQTTRPELRLVLAGKRGWNCEEIYEEAANLAGSVLMPGRIATEDLPVLYKMASCYVLPSLYEGFGMPVIESMACGTPNLLSNRAALPEVGADAAMYFDPYSAEDIAERVLSIVNDTSRMSAMREAGLSRCLDFSWAIVGDTTAKALKTLLVRSGKSKSRRLVHDSILGLYLKLRVRILFLPFHYVRYFLKIKDI